jgi:uncharacterized protein (DUF305 family)
MRKLALSHRGAAALAVVAAAACAGGAQRQPAGEVPPAVAPAGVNAADVRFMSDMIVHHAQAVLMAGWAPGHDASPAVRTLCERIIVSQNDEIAFMQRWLRERQQPLPDAHAVAGHAMPGMELMPGMLTADQLAQLDGAWGREFDRLFLTFMIQHHQGALTMVQQLLATPGAAQDGVVFQFSAGVSADQSAEIDRMSRMLATLP